MLERLHGVWLFSVLDNSRREVIKIGRLIAGIIIGVGVVATLICLGVYFIRRRIAATKAEREAAEDSHPLADYPTGAYEPSTITSRNSNWTTAADEPFYEQTEEYDYDAGGVGAYSQAAHGQYAGVPTQGQYENGYAPQGRYDSVESPAAADFAFQQATLARQARHSTGDSIGLPASLSPGGGRGSYTSYGMPLPAAPASPAPPSTSPGPGHLTTPPLRSSTHAPTWSTAI